MSKPNKFKKINKAYITIEMANKYKHLKTKRLRKKYKDRCFIYWNNLEVAKLPTCSWAEEVTDE